jgi:hypothetical protein
MCGTAIISAVNETMVQVEDYIGEFCEEGLCFKYTGFLVNNE